MYKWVKWGLIFFSTRPYLYHLEYIQFWRKILFIKIKINENHFLLVLHCLGRSAEVYKRVKWGLIFFSRQGPTCTISNTSNWEWKDCLLIENRIKIPNFMDIQSVKCPISNQVVERIIFNINKSASERHEVQYQSSLILDIRLYSTNSIREHLICCHELQTVHSCLGVHHTLLTCYPWICNLPSLRN